MSIYETTINKIGESVEAFLGEKMLILFGDNAPAELADYCLLIEMNQVNGPIKSGGLLHIGDNHYSITAVGDAVEKNLNALGHITLKFDGSTEPELPGTLYLEEKNIGKIEPGDRIVIDNNHL